MYGEDFPEMYFLCDYRSVRSNVGHEGTKIGAVIYEKIAMLLSYFIYTPVFTVS